MPEKLLTGKIIRVETRRMGSVVDLAAPGNAELVTLESVRDFHDSGGFVTIGNILYPYAGRVLATDQIAFAPGGLGTALARFVNVWLHPASYLRYAFVAMDDSYPTDLAIALIPHALSGFVPYDGRRNPEDQEIVSMERVGDELVVRDIESTKPMLNSNAIQKGAITSDKIGDYAVAVTQFKSTNHFLY